MCKSTNPFFSLSFRFATCIMVFSFLLACSRKEGNDNSLESASDSCLSSELIALIDTADLKQAEVEVKLNFVGKISFDESKVVRVYPLLSGVVQNVKVELGDAVRKGQELATVRSADVANLQDDYLDAQSDLIEAKRQLTAAEEMFQGGLSSEKEVTIAREEFSKAKSRVDKTKEVIGIYKATHKAEFKILAPASGFIVQKSINTGMELRSDNNEAAFVVGSLDKVWALAEIFEADMDEVKTGMPVAVTVSALPGKVFKGVVDRLTETLDPETRTVQARIELDNPDKWLKPEMFASVVLNRDEGKKLPVVPAGAIVFDDPNRYVVVWEGPCRSHIEKITVDSQTDSLCYVEGLSPNAHKVVTQGSLNMYNALKN